MSNNNMKNADMPAMPMFNQNGEPIHRSWSRVGDGSLSGLTKREMFAMNAMQGITSNEFGNYTGANWSEDIAKEAVKLADALLAELEK